MLRGGIGLTLAMRRRRTVHLATVLGLLAICVLAGRALLGTLIRIRVEGASMAPTFNDGDRLLMTTVAPKTLLGPGRVVVVRDPRPHRDQLMIKRISSVDDRGFTVLGDNLGASTDSRTFGPIPRDGIVGIVVRRYFTEAKRAS